MISKGRASKERASKERASKERAAKRRKATRKSHLGNYRRDVTEPVRALIDLYFRWVRRGDSSAAAVLGDALAEHGYDDTAERITKSLRGRRVGGRAYDNLRFDTANILLQIARNTSHTSIDPRVESDMVQGIEDAVWLPTWASAMEEAGRSREMPRNIVRGSVPEIPITGRELARRYALALMMDNKTSLTDLWRRASEADGAEADPEHLGYYLAMQGQGHGVSWFDDHEDFDVKLPHAEWYASEHGARWDVQGYP